MIHKLLKDKRMELFNGFPKLARSRATLGTFKNIPEAKIEFPNFYEYSFRDDVVSRIKHNTIHFLCY